jgi:hypothetical protein
MGMPALVALIRAGVPMGAGESMSLTKVHLVPDTRKIGT